MSSIVHTIKLVAQAKDAIAEIKKYGDTIVGTAQTVKKYESTLSGDKLLKSAHDWTAAVEKIGGATRLTAAEQTKVNRILGEAIEKYKLLGQEAPAAMRELEAATRKADAATRKADSGFGSLAGSFAKVTSLAATFGVSLGVGTLVSAGRAALSYADSLGEMATGLDMNVERLQELGYVASQNGSSLEGMVGALQNMGQRLGDGDDSVVGAVKRLGLGFDAIRKASPDQAFTQIAAALRQIEDANTRNALAADIFGKSWKQLMPTLMADIEKLKTEAPKWSDAEVKALGEVQDAWDRVITRAKIYAGRPIVVAANVLRGQSTYSSKFGPGPNAVPPTAIDITPPKTPGSPSAFDLPPLTRPMASPAEIAKLERATASLRHAGDKLQGAADKLLQSSSPYTPGRHAVPVYGMGPGIWEAPAIGGPAGIGEAMLPSTNLTNGMWTAPSVTGGKLPATGASKWAGAKGMALGMGASMLGSYLSSKDSKLAKGAGGALSMIGTGAMIGSVIPGLGTAAGAAIGAAIGLVKGLSGPTKTQTAGREADKQIDALREQLLATYGSLENIRTKGGEAGKALAAVWDRRGVDGLKLITAAAGKFKDALNIQGEIDTLKAQLQGLKDQQVPTWDQMTQAAGRYGIAMDTLGPKVQQLGITQAATQILNDFNTLVAGGAEVGNVLTGMSTAINQLVQDSIRYGTALPENMKPVIQGLIQQGQLFDAAGTAITDLAGLKWGAAVETEADKITKAVTALVDKIKELVDKLNGVDGKTVSATVQVNQKYTYDEANDPTRAADTAALGGYVTARGIRYMREGGKVLRMLARGSDTVPAMLTPGEFVWSPEAVANVGAENVAAMHAEARAGRGVGGDVTQVIEVRIGEEVIGRLVAKGLRKHVKVMGVA